MRAGNPLLNEETFQTQRSSSTELMTIGGTVNKTLILLALCILSSYYTWFSPHAQTLILPAAIGGFILALVTIFKKTWAPITAPIYVLFQGVALGAISVMYEVQMPGIVFQAISLTFATLGLMLFLFRYKIIRVTDKLRSGILIATGAIAVVYLISIVLGFFGKSVPMIHDSGPMGIGFSLLVVGIAAFNLLLDFDSIEKSANSNRAPAYMEWYGAFALMVTLIWLYLEILRLLGKIKGGRR
jgi:uncharacterized YccA/Bax inhibitor family protein